MRLALLVVSAVLAGCMSLSSTLTPKDPVVATQRPANAVNTSSAAQTAGNPAAVPAYPHYEYRSSCGKPCQPVSVRWQHDGAYRLQQGDAAEVVGTLSAHTVQSLSSLYSELRTLTLKLPRDLTRASICQRYATDHAQKVFATPATVDGWTFKDNHGCTGFAEATALRELEARIEALLPLRATQ